MSQLNFLGSQLDKAVIKIELSSLLQKEVLRDLQRMNLNRASLFPDLDGYAASLRLRYNSLKTPEELFEDQIKCSKMIISTSFHEQLVVSPY